MDECINAATGIAPQKLSELGLVSRTRLRSDRRFIRVVNALTTFADCSASEIRNR